MRNKISKMIALFGLLALGCDDPAGPVTGIVFLDKGKSLACAHGATFVTILDVSKP